MKFVLKIIAFCSVALLKPALADEDWYHYGADYEAKLSQEKHDSLWTQITLNSESNGWYSPLENNGLFIESMDPTMKWVGDSFEDTFLLGPRKKYVHSVGNVAKIKFETIPNNANYTGFFATGAEYGYMRLSTAHQPDESKIVASKESNFAPGMALKFLRDGMHSANLLTMFEFVGQPSWNYFSNDFVNHIPGPNAMIT
jgi:hypothetical protein